MGETTTELELELMSTEDAAQYLGVGTASVRLWVHRGRISSRTSADGDVGFRREELDEFLEWVSETPRLLVD